MSPEERKHFWEAGKYFHDISKEKVSPNLGEKKGREGKTCIKTGGVAPEKDGQVLSGRVNTPQRPARGSDHLKSVFISMLEMGGMGVTCPGAGRRNISGGGTPINHENQENYTRFLVCRIKSEKHKQQRLLKERQLPGKNLFRVAN